MSRLSISCFIFLWTLVALAQAQEEHHEELSISQRWGFGILTGICLSIIGFLAGGLFVLSLKCCSKQIFQVLIQFLNGLAVGAMMSDVTTHILP